MPIEKPLDSLVINKIESQEVYNYMVENNLINENELYLTPEVEAKPLTGEDIAISASDNTSIKDKLDSVNSELNSINSELDEKLNIVDLPNGIKTEEFLPEMPLSNVWTSMAYGNEIFVAMGYYSSEMTSFVEAASMYSYDGFNWMVGNASINISWRNVVYGNGKFVAVANDSDIAAYSLDGINWTQITLPYSNINIVYGNNKFIILDNSGLSAYSYDGINWETISSSPRISGLTSMAYGNGKFVAIGTNSNVAAYSEDGINWIQTTMPMSAGWVPVVYGNGKFVSCDRTFSFSNVAAYSEDGINWIQTTLPTSKTWGKIAYGNGKFIIPGDRFPVVLYSTDGITWNETTIPYDTDDEFNFYNTIYGNGKFIVNPNNAGRLIYSYDGINWEKTVNRIIDFDGNNLNEIVSKSLDINSKQSIISGSQGQFVGFDASGSAIAQDLHFPESLPEYTSADNGKSLTIVNGSPIWASGFTQFEWGDETADGDAAWWNELKDWVITASESELESCLGKTKSVTLSEEVLGTTTHLVQCIGYNCDGKNTLTFQTKNTLANTTVFGTSNGYWIGSTVRSLCNDYYNAFPSKAAIKTVSKGTCATVNNNQTGIPTYNQETVFLPSDCEMGFIAGLDWESGKGYASSYDEFCEENTSKIPYQYYTDNTSRIKYENDSSTSTRWCLERSVDYNNTDFVCHIEHDGSPLNYARFNENCGFAPAFAIGETTKELPSYSSSNNGQFLMIVDGVPAWTTIPFAEEASF